MVRIFAIAVRAIRAFMPCGYLCPVGIASEYSGLRSTALITPRYLAMGHCLRAIGIYLLTLPHPRTPRRSLNLIINSLEAVNTKRIRRSGLHRFVDAFQIGIGDIHESLTNAYFRSR